MNIFVILLKCNWWCFKMFSYNGEKKPCFKKDNIQF